MSNSIHQAYEDNNYRIADDKRKKQLWCMSLRRILDELEFLQRNDLFVDDVTMNLASQVRQQYWLKKNTKEGVTT